MSIHCECGGATSVIDSRHAPEAIHRRRKCKACGNRFSTVETVAAVKLRSEKLPIGTLVKKKGITPVKGWIVGYWRVSRAMHGYTINSYDDPGALINITHGGVSEWSEPQSNKIIWTPEMVNALIKARSENASYLDCAELIGVDYLVISKKCHELGIGGKRNNGVISGREVNKRENSASPSEAKP